MDLTPGAMPPALYARAALPPAAPLLWNVRAGAEAFGDAAR